MNILVLGGDPWLTRVTDEYKSFIFLPLPVLTASPDGEPPRSQVNIPWVAWKLSVKAAMSSMEAIQRATAPALQVKIPMMVVSASSPGLSVEEEGL
jgi:hypothetical protein